MNGNKCFACYPCGSLRERKCLAFNKQTKQNLFLILFVHLLSIGCWWETSRKIGLCVLKDSENLCLIIAPDKISV